MLKVMIRDYSKHNGITIEEQKARSLGNDRMAKSAKKYAP